MKSNLFMAAACLFTLMAGPARAKDAAGTWRDAIDNHLLSLVHIDKTTTGFTGTFADHEQPLSVTDIHAVRLSPISRRRMIT